MCSMFTFFFHALKYQVAEVFFCLEIFRFRNYIIFPFRLKCSFFLFLSSLFSSYVRYSLAASSCRFFPLYFFLVCISFSILPNHFINIKYVRHNTIMKLSFRTFFLIFFQSLSLPLLLLLFCSSAARLRWNQNEWNIIYMILKWCRYILKSIFHQPKTKWV